MQEPATLTVNDRIAHRVRSLRAAGGLSLDAMASRCAVSRSMLSLIERGESSPTAVVLEKIASGLNVPLASLFEAPEREPDPVSRRDEQPAWHDPESGYLRRNVSPGGVPSPIQIVEVSFPPGAGVAYENGIRAARIHQQVWVLEGAIEVTVGEALHELETGDCLALELDRPTAFHNRSGATARYAVVLVSEPSAGR